MIILLLLFSIAAFAQDDVCLPPGLPSETELMRVIRAPIAFWAASHAQMEAAPCKTKIPPSTAAMEKVIASNSDRATETKLINGVTLSDDPRMLKMFERLTTRWLSPMQADSANTKNFQNLYSINPACDKVRCAMEKIWGPGLTKQLSYLYLQLGFNSSEYSFPDSDRFTENELTDVLVGLNDFPLKMSPLVAENRQLSRYTRGKWLIRPGTFGDSSVVLYDPWTRAVKMERQQTIFHEVSHTLAEHGSVDRSDAWLDISGWEELGEDNWRATKPSCMISKYGSKTPDEDFAETSVAYRYNPARLYKACPAKYQFMKKFFRGVEYFAEESCKTK